MYTTANNWAITQDVWFSGSEGVGDIIMPGNCNDDTASCYTKEIYYWAGCWEGDQECYVEADVFGEATVYLYRYEDSNNWNIDIQGNERDRKDICRWAQERKYLIGEGCESDAERECEEKGGWWHPEDGTCTWK